MDTYSDRPVLPRKLRAQADLEYRKLPLEERKVLIAAYKRERQVDPRVDWQSWLWRRLHQPSLDKVRQHG
jgi:hypothetical protein